MRVTLIALAEFVYEYMCRSVCVCVCARSSPLYDRYVSTEQWLLCECDFRIFCITHTIRFLKNTLCLQCTHIHQRTSEARGRAHTHAGTQSHIKSKAQCSYFCRVLGRILFRAAFWLDWRSLGRKVFELQAQQATRLSSTGDKNKQINEQEKILCCF